MNDKLGLGRKRVAAPLIAAFAILALSVHANAQNGWLRDGSPLDKQPNTATSGDFAVMQIATTEPEKLMADWNEPTPGVSLVTTTQATRNQPIVTFIVFKGCRADAAGNCNVTVDYVTLGPDGKTYDNTKAAEVWVGHPPAPGLNLQLSASGYGLRIEDKDPLGTYRVSATITDHVAGATLHTEQSLTIVTK